MLALGKLLLTLGLAGVGVVAISKAFAKPGDKLQVGDDAFVRVGPGGVDPAGLPQGIGAPAQIVVRVSSLDGTSLQGMITSVVAAGAASFTPLAAPVGPVQVLRSAVASVVRNGVTVAAS